MDLINIRRVAWGKQPKQNTSAPVRVDPALVEMLAAKILERLR